MKKSEKLEFVISEMTDDTTGVKVPYAKGVDVKTLTEGDDKPMFVVLEALSEGQSKNGRYYDRETIYSIEKQINETKPDAYEGHMKDEDRAFARPDPKTIWIGAKVYEIDGKAHLFVKGYVLPYAKNLKTYLRASKSAGKNVAVSIYGRAKEIFDRIKNAKVVMDFTLESLDWARSGAAGVEPVLNFAITKEMVDDQKTILEMFDEYRDELKEVVKQELLAGDSEMKVIREMTGDGKEPVQVIREMFDKVNTLEKELADIELNKELSSKVTSPFVRKIVRRLVVAEMKNSDYNRGIVKEMVDKVLTSEEGKAIIKEVQDRQITPKVDNRLTNSRKYTKI